MNACRRQARGRTPHVIWVSTSLHTRGGVASCVRTLQQTPLQQSWSARHIATHQDGSALRKIMIFASGLAQFVGSVLHGRPDLVHLHTASYGSFARKATVAAVSRLLRIPVVLHVHGAEFHRFYERSPRVVRSIIRRTLESSAAVVALGDRWADRLRAIAPTASVIVVPNAVRPVGEAVQPGLGEPVHVVFLGEIGDRKGTFTLLDAWAKAAAEATTAARLTIAGAGEFERAARRIAELGLDGSVELRQWLSPADVAQLLTTAQVLCLPSRDEGQPMAVLEAMAHGLCIVASPVGGIPEMLADDSGVLVPPDDAEALAMALRRVLDDADERVRLGNRALSRIRTTFDVNVVWRQFDELYRKVTQR